MKSIIERPILNLIISTAILIELKQREVVAESTVEQHLYLFVERSALSNQIDRKLMQDVNWQRIQQQATLS